MSEPTTSDATERVRLEDVRKTKVLRLEIDTVLQGVKSLSPARETSLVITKLQEANMWLGMNLKRLGEENPYPNSRKPENTIVDPTADGLKF
jgi:hypothetical protein